jgi:hypothetical protein
VADKLKDYQYYHKTPNNDCHIREIFQMLDIWEAVVEEVLELLWL